MACKPPRRVFPRRMIHLDFHTGPAIPDVGRDFDPEAFARTFADAHVDSVTVFAKCHHGHLYYATERPERHLGLAKGLDLLALQIEALHRRGIAAPIYLSAQVDEYAATRHPEWCAMDPEGRIVKAGGPLAASWHCLDMSSPYQDYLAEQLDEVLERFRPVDGIFLDMCWDQTSCSQWAMAAMRQQGLDPASAIDRHRYARSVAHAYMARFKRMIDCAQKGHAPAYIWFNSRPKTNLYDERKYLRHIEVECLPTGGWGYAYFPYVARFVRPLALPTLSHTGRFHKSWGDFGGLKPEAALQYECCSMLSMNITSGIGDQLHPRGALDAPAYAMIGRVYGHIAACERWVEGAKLVSEIAVIIDPEQGDNPGPAGLGLVRALQQLRHQFDLLPATASLKGYPVVIVPECVRIQGQLKEALRAHLRAGGKLLVSGGAALDEAGQPALDELGLRVHGESPFTTTYLRANPRLMPGLPRMDHVLYERGLRMTPARGARSLCSVVEPYFERSYEHFCSHYQTPPDRLSPFAAIIESGGNNKEAGRAITFAAPIFSAYGLHASLAYRQLIGACLTRLLPEPLLRDGGPSHLEATVVRAKQRTVVHLVSFYPSRRTHSGQPEIIEDPIPLVDMPLSVRLDSPPKRVLLAPRGESVPFEYKNGRAELRVTATEGHVMVVFE